MDPDSPDPYDVLADELAGERLIRNLENLTAELRGIRWLVAAELGVLVVLVLLLGAILGVLLA